jgi:hypothetical protein
MAMEYPKIARAEAISDRILRIEFTNQEIKNYDISPLLEKPMFSPLQEQPASKASRLSLGDTPLFGMMSLTSVSTSYGRMERWKPALPWILWTMTN